MKAKCPACNQTIELHKDGTFVEHDSPNTNSSHCTFSGKPRPPKIGDTATYNLDEVKIVRGAFARFGAVRVVVERTRDKRRFTVALSYLKAIKPGKEA